MTRKTLISFTLNIFYETEKAIRVGETTDPSEGFWLPKSKIEYAETGANIVEVTMPEWLAEEKGIL